MTFESSNSALGSGLLLHPFVPVCLFLGILLGLLGCCLSLLIQDLLPGALPTWLRFEMLERWLVVGAKHLVRLADAVRDIAATFGSLRTVVSDRSFSLRHFDCHREVVLPCARNSKLGVLVFAGPEIGCSCGLKFS